MPFPNCASMQKEGPGSHINLQKGIGGTLYGVCCMHGWSKSGAAKGEKMRAWFE